MNNKQKPQKLLTRLHVFERRTRLFCPLFSSRISAGFPSPAEDFIEDRLDLNDLLVEHPAATFFMRASGDSMTGAGIHDGDILVVDRAAEPKDGSIVIAVLSGELTVKRIRMQKGSVELVPENPAYLPIAVTEEMGFEVWGVVTSVIHQLKK